MNNDLRGIILQYASITDSRYQALLESKEVDVSDFSEMLDSLSEIKNYRICNELYGQGLMLETNVGSFCVVSRSKSTGELYEMVNSDPDGALEHIKTECYVYRQLNEKMGEYALDMDPSEGDIYKKGSEPYVVADVSSRHVALFDMKNQTIVEPISSLNKYEKVLDQKEFINLSRKFEKITEGKRYLNYHLTESLEENSQLSIVNDKISSDDAGPDEGDFYVNKIGEYFIVADVSSRHVGLFSSDNKPIVESHSALNSKYKKVINANQINKLTDKFDWIVRGDRYRKFSLSESVQTGDIITKKSTLQVLSPSDETKSDIVGKAFEFDDGIYVVTDVIDGTVYMIGPDDDMYQISKDDFEDEVVREIDEDILDGESEVKYLSK